MKAVDSWLLLPDNSWEAYEAGVFMFPKMATTARTERKKEKKQRTISVNKFVF